MRKTKIVSNVINSINLERIRLSLYSLMINKKRFYLNLIIDVGSTQFRRENNNNKIIDKIIMLNRKYYTVVPFKDQIKTSTSRTMSLDKEFPGGQCHSPNNPSIDLLALCIPD